MNRNPSTSGHRLLAATDDPWSALEAVRHVDLAAAERAARELVGGLMRDDPRTREELLNLTGGRR